jgi:hypothetical protein
LKFWGMTESEGEWTFTAGSSFALGPEEVADQVQVSEA